MQDILFKDSDRTEQKTYAFSVIKANHLMLYREILARFLDLYNALNTLCMQNVTFINFKPRGA
jgi:hypothetical protein